MAVKLFSADVEKKVLKTLCASAEGQKLWVNLTAKHFATEVGSLTFKRIQHHFKRHGELPSWSSLLTDPGLPDRARSALKAFKAPPARVTKNIKAISNSLEVYRKKRGLDQLSRQISEQLSAEGNEIDGVLDNVSKAFADIGRADTSLKTHTIGSGDTALELVTAILKGKVQQFIPTGFRAYDAINYGIPLGSLMLVAGASGSGKSAVLGTLGRNMALKGGEVLFAPLEMETDAMLQRELSTQTGINLTKFLNPKVAMTLAEKQKALKSYKRLSLQIRKAGGKLTFWEQDQQASIDAILGHAKAHGYKIVVVDYVGLLAGTDGDDQVRAFSRITKQCKLWAKNNRAIVILAAQLNDDGKIKYSRAMNEDASTMWSFTRTAQDKEQNTVTVDQGKSRQQSDHQLRLFMDLSTMTVRDLTSDEANALKSIGGGGSGAAAKGKSGKKAKTRSAKFFNDI
jgi:replicative DNA helicase